jgi:hypothetical protein
MNDICINPSEQSVLNRPSTDKFILILNLPHIIKGEVQDKERLKIDPLQISVYGSVVPQIEIPAIQAPYGGQTYNITSMTRPNYTPLEVNFVVDSGFSNYWILWKWLAVLNDPRKSIYKGKINSDINGDERKKLVQNIGQAEYETTVSLLGLNEYNKAVIEFTYFNSFITNLGGINYNYRETNIVESSFRLQYSQFDVKLLQ